LQDWLLKIFSTIGSFKTALISLLTGLSIVVSWQDGILLIKSNGLPDSIAPLLLVIILYSFSHLAILALYSFVDFINRRIDKLKLLRNKKENLEGFKKSVRKIIPELPPKQLHLLKLLSKKEQTLHLIGSSVRPLLEQNYIIKLHKVSRGEYIFEINPIVKTELRIYLKYKREIIIETFTNNITDLEKRFLDMFFSEAVPSGTYESKVRIDRDIYSCGSLLANKGLLDHLCNSTTKEKFKLHADLASVLATNIFNKAPVRYEIILDTNFIPGTQASGSGVI